jgi:hypothetical protein
MFMERIRQLAVEWGKSPEDLNQVARESLLYGMRLNTKPTQLKKELKRVGIDSTIATPRWSGTYYLLICLPQVLTDRKKKIPSLEDYLFAKTVLAPDQLDQLTQNLKKIPDVSRHEIVAGLMKKTIKFESRRGRFLPRFDRMYENDKDVKQDLLCEALAIMNKEWCNFQRPDDAQEIHNYISHCVKGKTATYLKSCSPRMKRAKLDEPGALENIIDKQSIQERNLFDADEQSTVLKEDLRSMLPYDSFQAVALLMNFAEDAEEQRFQSFLRSKGHSRIGLSYTRLKMYIERYMGTSIFLEIRKSEKLESYLRG